MRTERDSMGEMQVPAGAYYGAQTQRAVQNFPISGQRIPRRVIQALGLIKHAAATFNEGAGVLDADRAGAVRRAADEVASGQHDADFVVDVFQTGSGTSSNMNTNEVIANRANELLGGQLGANDPVHPNDHVNAGQSSNDVFPTAVHVAAYLASTEELLPALRTLESSLAGKARAFADVVKPGRTHLMDATPVTLGQEFGGYARQLALGIERVEAALPRVAELPLGGTAVGTGLNAPAGMTEAMLSELRERTGADALREASDHFEAQGARDGLVELSGACKTVAVSLTKIANDVRLLGSGPRTGIAELQLPAVQPGSSIMPAKVNPVIPESVTQVCAQVIGNDTAATVGGMNGHLELNVYIPVMARNVLESVHLLATSAENFARQCIDGVEANEARATELVEKDLAIVTALVPAIGYDKSAELSKRALEQDRPLREVVKEAGVLSDEEVDRALDTKAMTEGGVIGE
ncbi:class II fumarate hydratase [Egibacter rhizosphaerae]|uniref:Fumarate hydratase class II n=1 Tax=Egibacter rhizosphaerae TaxID=1670831 RepID=A0A411YJ05_9ACTN|nr:class II fumarate hydratase [Egibacter rhizosphaerae]QBI21131.1 class II fumarate hydratase [Egibacter rhizosphaerae]